MLNYTTIKIESYSLSQTNKCYKPIHRFAMISQLFATTSSVILNISGYKNAGAVNNLTWFNSRAGHSRVYATSVYLQNKKDGTNNLRYKLNTIHVAIYVV